MQKKSIIVLENQQTHEPHEFGYEHAVRLLTQEKKRGFSSWNLPNDSKYYFQNGNIIIKPSAGGALGSKEQKEVEAGRKARATYEDAHGIDPELG